MAGSNGANGAANGRRGSPDLDAMAQEWVRARRAHEETQGAPQERPPATEFRQTPDGSRIHPNWSLDWQGKQGDLNSLVTLRSKDGRVLVSGQPFYSLAQREIMDPLTRETVWVPSPAYARLFLEAEARRVSDLNRARAPRNVEGMLAAVDEHEAVGEGRKRLAVGGGLAVLAVAGVGYMGWRLWRAWSSGSAGSTNEEE